MRIARTARGWMPAVIALVVCTAGCDRVFGIQELPLPEIDAPPNAGSMVVFDGVDDFIPLVRPIADDFTIELWIKTTQSSTSTEWHRGIGLVYADAPSTANDFGLSIGGTLVAFGVGNPDVTLHSTSAITLGAWTHLAATRDATSGRLAVFVNGRMEAEIVHSNRASLTAQNTISIGHATSFFATEKFYAGAIDELRLWTVVRTATQINDHHASLLTGNEPGLVGYYRFDDGQGPMATDASPTAYHAALGGGVMMSAPAWEVSDAPLR